MFEAVAAPPKRVPSPYPLADTWAGQQNLVLPSWTMAWLQDRLVVRRRYRWRLATAVMPIVVVPIVVFATGSPVSSGAGVLAIAVTWGWMMGAVYIFERQYQRADATAAVVSGPRIARPTRLRVRDVVGFDFLWTSVALTSVGLVFGAMSLIERPADTPLSPTVGMMIVLLMYAVLGPVIVREARNRPSHGRDLLELAVDDRLRSISVRDRLAPFQSLPFFLSISGMPTLSKLGNVGTCLGAAVLGLYLLSMIAMYRWTWSRPMSDAVRSWYGWPAMWSAGRWIVRQVKR